jgi:hypothetical protein
MALKRKRSIDSSPISTSSLASSTPESQSPTAFQAARSTYNTETMDTETTSPFTSWPVRKPGCNWDSSAEMGCRTRKRCRDNRPDERLVHGMFTSIYSDHIRFRRTIADSIYVESTLRRLYSAQRDHPHASPIPTQNLSHTYPTPVSISAPVQKSTLHSFWNISTPPVQPPIFQIHETSQTSVPRCEDCDSVLLSDGMDIDVDMDLGMDGGSVASPLACNNCGRSVCGTCAVVGDQRVCLGCARA